MALELPPPGQEPSPEWVAAYMALSLADRLAIAVKIAERLKHQAAAAFGDVPTKNTSSMSTEQRISEGEEVAAELLTIAIQLAPDATLDQLETSLANDKPSAQQAESLLQRIKKKD